MPVPDGFEATRRIRQIESEAGDQHIPIIALTAHVLEDDRVRCQEAGMSSVLTKPLSMDELRETLETWAAVVSARS